MPVIEYIHELPSGMELTCMVDFHYSPGTPDRPYGDPPEPGDPEELIIESIMIQPGTYRVVYDETDKLIRFSEWEVKEEMHLSDFCTIHGVRETAIEDYCMKWIVREREDRS